MYVIDMSEEQINIKIVQTVEKFPVIYDYSSLGHSNKEEIDKAWHALSKEVNIDGKYTMLSTRLIKVMNPPPFPYFT
jgi:hypothetical protein